MEKGSINRLGYIADNTSGLSTKTDDISNYLKRDIGGTNCYFITGATTSSEVTGSTVASDNTFGKVVFLTNCHWTSVVSTQILNSTNWTTNTSMAAGTELFAKITKVKTKVGTCIMYLY